MRRGTGVEDGVDAAVEIFEHMRGGRGTGVAEGVGAGRGDGNARSPDQFESHRVRGHAHADQRAAGGDASGTAAERGSSSVSGPGQNAAMSLRAFSGMAVTSCSSIGFVGFDRPGNVHDHRVPRRPLLGGEDARHGCGIKRVGAQAVDGFGRKARPGRRRE